MGVAKFFAVAGLAVMGLAGCKPEGDGTVKTPVDVSSQYGGTQAPTILARYNLVATDIVEYQSRAMPGMLCLLTDGVEAGDVSCFEKTGAAAIGAPQILARYYINGHDVVEFTPASDPGMVCMVTDGPSSGGIHCARHQGIALLP